MRITEIITRDVRFPTSKTLAGSDAVHTSPDYSAAYVVLKTDRGIEGHGLSFTCGRGTELVVAGIQSLAPLVLGRSLDGIVEDFKGFWRALTSDGQLRWTGPEKGVIHLATGAVVNAVWDLLAKSRPESQADGGRQPGLGRGHGDPSHEEAGAIQPLVDRGAHQPGRRVGT